MRKAIVAVKDTGVLSGNTMCRDLAPTIGASVGVATARITVQKRGVAPITSAAALG
jgi:hypothetical protein